MNSKKNTIIIIIGILILIFLLIGLINIPTVSDILKLKKMIYLERVDLEKKYLRSQVLKKILSDFERVQPQKEKIDSIFIPLGKELEFITTLEEYASKHKVKQEVSIGKTIDKSGVYTISPLNIKLEGNFKNTLDYINDLNKISYYYNILSLTINGTESENIQTTLNGEIYILKK